MKRSQLVIIAALVAAPGWASAQTYGTGMGFPIGEKSRLHTTLDLSLAYDTNPSRFDRGREGVPDWKGMVRPGLEVNVPGVNVALDMRGRATIHQFFGMGDAAGGTFAGGDLGVALRLGSEDSLVGFRIDNQLVRTPTFMEDPGTFAADERRFREWNNRGTARLTLRPGGRALEFDVGYTNEVIAYDDLPSSQRHGALIEARWRFLPKTALIFNSNVSWFSSFGLAPETTATAVPISASLGLVGQITPRLTAELIAGYIDTFTAVPDRSLRNAIASAALTYTFVEGSFLTVGYRRRVAPIIIFDSFIGDSPYTQLRLGLGGRLIFNLFASYEYRRYPPRGTLPDDTAVHMVVGDARIEYWFFEYLNASIGYRLFHQDPTAQFFGDPMDPGTGALFLQDFTRHQALLTLGFRY